MPAALLLAAPFIGQAIKSGVDVGSKIGHARELTKLMKEKQKQAAGPAQVSAADAAAIATAESSYAARVQEQLKRGAGIITGGGPSVGESARQAAKLAGQKFGHAKETSRIEKEGLRKDAAALRKERGKARREAWQAGATAVGDFAKFAPEAQALGEKLRAQKTSKLTAARTAAMSGRSGVAPGSTGDWTRVSPGARGGARGGAPGSMYGPGGVWDLYKG